MNTHTDKTQDDKDKSIVNTIAQKQNNSGATLQLVDDRPEAVALQKLQETANNSLQVKQTTQLQAMADGYSAQQEVAIQKKENNTGLPDNLKSGIENLSGYAMDDVKVHYNSDKPGQLQAHAYAQGTDIHIASGQEKHLPHEAWHVVQQKQGRVQPTIQMKGKVNINDNADLEKEADVMGEKALQLMQKTGVNHTCQTSSSGHSIVQMKAREAEVEWSITHLVRDQGDSLFGEDTEEGWQDGELSVEEGELVRGQRIVVDDERIFMSRRSSNQENRDKRRADITKELKHKWYLVLAVDDKSYAGRNVYIRSETIKFSEIEPREQRPMEIVEIPEDEELSGLVSQRLNEIQQAWRGAALKRRRSIGQVKYKGDDEVLPEELSSGWNWDQYDEGEDVAGDMAKPENREYMQAGEPNNFTLSAHYGDDPLATKIAFLVMEEWERPLLEDASGYQAPEEQFFYIRWLIGHPELKGGGSAVMERAKEKAIALQKAIYVQVAYSAVGWYRGAGFTVVEAGEFQEEQGYGDTLLKFTPPPPLPVVD